MSPVTASPPSLADRIEDLLPQTQCTKCGYPACRPYAEAIADGTASYDQCPPGGAEGIARLAALLGKPVIPLNIEHGVERPRPVARIDESLCIGCTLCIQACPVDAIIGAAKRMHTVVESLCTGCDLCVAPCPVDCIEMVPVTGDATGWDAWSQDQADAARAHHDRHMERERQARQAAEQRIAERQAAHKAHLATRPADPGERLGGDATVTPESASAIDAPTTSAPAPQGDVRSLRAAGTAGAASVSDSSGTSGTSDTSGTSGASGEPGAPLSPEERKRAIIAAAMERARQKKNELAERGFGPRNTEHVSADVQKQIDEADARRKRLGIDDDSK
ncbi:Na+-translocating ferredoxin:NAD+ oxidoreductase subunit B [Pararobbsia alpina]|uniref:electron transport complex subunit RsxB n=1 Tax=Pararobbsia alpina TaxID=621374 RepID=UPI0039A4BB2C